MPIPVRCVNIISFDQSSGSYRTCDEEMMIEEELAGQVVTCPVCSNVVEVPFEQPKSLLHQVDRDEELFGDDELQIAPLEIDPPRNESPQIESIQFDGTNGDSLSPSPEIADGSLSATSKTQKESQSKSEEPSQKVDYTEFKKSEICHHCGAQLTSQNAVCPVCNKPRSPGYHKVDYIKEPRYRFTGFQLWFKERMVPEKGGVVGMLMIALATSGVALLSIVVGAKTGWLGLVLLTPLWMIPVAFLLILRRWHVMLKNPRATLKLWQKAGWYFLLQVNRMGKWKRWFDSDSTRTVLDLRKERVVNIDLQQREDLIKANVLDLENQAIDDEGIKYLHKRMNLLFIVLRGTRVTPEGVFQLQQTIPRAWIWY